MIRAERERAVAHGDDADLAARAAGRDAEACREIMQRHNRRLYRIARSILRNDSEAEDAVQNGYVHAFAALAGFRGESSLATWLTRIVMNEALGMLRRRKPEVALDDHRTMALPGQVIPFPLASPDADPERAMAQRQIQAALECAIDELPDAFRVVLVARVLEGMSIEETADLLGLRPETVKTRLHRARRLLKQALERRIGPVLLDAFPFAGRRCERMTAVVLQGLGL